MSSKITDWCINPQRHRAFGMHLQGPEGWSCRKCRLGAAAPIEARPGSGPGTEANTPSPDAEAAPIEAPDISVDCTTGAVPAPSASTAPIPAPIPAPISRKRAPRICGHCGGRYVPRRSDQRWCSAPCRKNASDMRRYAYARLKAGLPYRPQPMRDRGHFKAQLRDAVEGQP